METVRQPAVAGRFYPGRVTDLVRDVDRLLETARDGRVPPVVPPRALIVPHAGYDYSGPTAACAYVQLEPFRSLITRVVLIGPAHYMGFRGLAVPSVEVFATPLGEVPLDHEVLDRLAEAGLVRQMDRTHGPEHSLEVQLPFLQRVLDAFTLVPVLVGDATPEEVEALIDACWGGPETILLISSDLCHYLPYARANVADTETLRRILALDGPLPRRSACGARGIDGMLLAARAHRLNPTLLDRRTSGDTAGDKAAVVGYAAVSFNEGAEVTR